MATKKAQNGSKVAKASTFTPEKKYNKTSKQLDNIISRETKAGRNPQTSLNTIRKQYVKDSTSVSKIIKKKK